MFYTATAYRWGNTNDHNYLVTITDNEEQALAAAKEACEERAGKYGVQVMVLDKGDYRQVAYFSSMAKELTPEHNYHFDMLQSIGSTIHEAVMAGGVVWEAPADSESYGPNVPREVEVPQWVHDTVKEAAVSCRASEEFEEQTRNAPVVTPAERKARRLDGTALANAIAVHARAEAEVERQMAEGLRRKAQLLSGSV